MSPYNHSPGHEFFGQGVRLDSEVDAILVAMMLVGMVMFWRHVEKRGPRGCWVRTGPTDKDGYGIYRGRRAHRVAYELSKGPIPKGKVVRHTVLSTMPSSSANRRE